MRTAEIKSLIAYLLLFISFISTWIAFMKTGNLYAMVSWFIQLILLLWVSIEYAIQSKADYYLPQEAEDEDEGVNEE